MENRSVPSNFMSDIEYSVITSDVIKSFDCSKQVLWQTVKTQTVAFHQCLHCLLRYEKYISF